jgi:ubiquitin carboxyl-terminal hydrolase 8
MLKGLANVGNTCSINTLVQCIGHCPRFLDCVLNNEFTITKRDNRSYIVYEELKAILKMLWVDNTSIIPRRFIEAFYESIGSGYQIGEQFDFTEMWMLLLDNIIHETHNENFIADYQTETHCVMQKKVLDSLNIHFKNTQSPLINLLHGSQIQQIKCESCGNESHIIEPVSFSYINHPTIFEGLQDLLKTHHIEEWKCEKCKSTEGTKNTQFWKLPTIWMIVIQRYNNDKKLTTPIDIPLIIDFDEGVEQSKTDKPPSYELKAIANHYGSLEGGHYTATCKNENSWCEYNDLQIMVIPNITEKLINNRTAYALFYERV